MTSLFDRLRPAGDPVAAPAASVISGNARFTVLTSRLIRLEWAADGVFEDRASYAFPNRRAAVPPFTTSESDEGIVLETAQLRLRHRADGRALSADNLVIDLTGPVGARWVPGTDDGQNIGGARRTVDGCRGEAGLESGLCSRSGWSVVDDTPYFVFDEDGWPAPRRDGERCDWYFFGYGHDYAAAVGEYTAFGGAVPLVPRWLLGGWWSRYHDYSEAELRALVEEFAARGFPLDVLVIDMDWHRPEAWTGYSWNRALFPDPPGFLHWLHDRGLHATLNLHPAQGVLPHEDAYADFAHRVGVADGSAVPFDITEKSFVEPYFELLHHPLEADGVDFWWMDWQQGRTSAIRGLDPLPWLNHLHFRDMTRHTDRRPVVFSRWGGLGSHRYPIGFSGDAWAQWSALAFQPRYTAAGANVGYGWWSHDIGGHHGADEPELYVRWVQFGAFSPVLRLHSNNRPESERRPWAFGAQIESIARQAFDARYELVPYLYTAARTASDSGVSVVRPMSWSSPEDDAAYVAREQYMLGPDLLVAPVVRPSLAGCDVADVDVWLPEGDWIERTTGEQVTGPRWYRSGAALDHVPQFVRPGTVLPLAAVTDNSSTTADQPADHVVLSVFPGGSRESRLYQDDGTSPDYRDAGSWTLFRTEQAGPGRLTLRIGAVEGRPVSPSRRFTVRIEHSRAPVTVLVDGAPVEFIRSAGRTVIDVAASRPDQPIDVEVATDGDSLLDERLAASARQALLDRVAGERSAADLAVALRGGPVAQVIEHTVPYDAARTLGHVVVGAPEQGTASVSVQWVVDRAGSSEQFGTDPMDVPPAGLVLDAPFAWSGSLTPVRWGAVVRVEWGEETLERRFTSSPLVPAVPSWWVRTDESPWKLRAIDPDDLDFPNLAQRAVFRFGSGWEPPTGRQRTATAVSTVTAVRDCEVAFSYFSGGQVTVRVDGHRIDADLTGNPPQSLFELHPRPRRTAAVRLTEGAHRLEVTCRKPVEVTDLDWYLSLVAVYPGTSEVSLNVIAEAGDSPSD